MLHQCGGIGGSSRGNVGRIGDWPPVPMASQAFNASSKESPTALTEPIVRPRLDSLDLWRGVIIVLMALDHTRDFFEGLQLPG